jgi:hypothetical protein
MTNFQDGDIIITETFAIKVTKTGRGWFAEVADAASEFNGMEVFGDRWYVIPALVEKVRQAMAVAAN